MNSRVTAKERNLLKGAIRRVFSRSELRRRVIDTAIVVGYHDPNRPRVKKWAICSSCKSMTPAYLLECDHIDPIIPIGKTLVDLSWDTVVNRTWCEQNNLQPICKPCHKEKSKAERKQRAKNKKLTNKP